MSSLIKQLSKEMINLISAGEVIEGPKNVIKELVENSIDAGASIIKVMVESFDNKIKKMSVIDNGKGMSKEDILLSIEPHATSKISSKDDLFNINTMGFRGEALSSIASVSYLTIKSKQKDTDGYFYDFQNSKVINEGLIPLTDGTQIEVSNLFYNTPARFKNLKSLPTEIGYITNLLENISLAYPNIKFSFVHNNNMIFQTPGNNELLDTLIEIYGTLIVDNLKSFKTNNQLYNIEGYLSNNNVYKNNKSYITMIVNGRVIQNNNLSFSILDAYKSIIPIGKYPIVVLNIKCDQTLLDVNVHPSKLEIRFTDEFALRQLITKCLKDVLFDTKLVYQVKEQDVRNNLKQEVEEKKQEFKENIIQKEESLDDLWNQFEKVDEKKKDLSNDIFNKYDEEPLKETNNVINETNIFDEIKEIDTEPLIEKSTFKFSDLKYIGQYNVTYLLLESDEDLYLIDQHAAMERVMYEKTLDLLNGEVQECIELLVPEKMNFSVSEKVLIDESLDELKKLGISLEFFGGTTYLIRTMPLWLPKGQEINFLTECIDLIIHNQKASRTVLYGRLAATIACKKSIKANMLILKEEVYELLKSLDNCKMPWTCPHGRPTTVKMTKYEIEKMFKRVI